jgi:hypothetical protein
MCGVHCLVIHVWMCLGWVVSVVSRPWSPLVAELTLGFAAAEPPEVHVHGFHLFGDDGFVGNTKCCGVVGLNWRLGLRSAHFLEGIS